MRASVGLRATRPPPSPHHHCEDLAAGRCNEPVPLDLPLSNQRIHRRAPPSTELIGRRPAFAEPPRALPSPSDLLRRICAASFTTSRSTSAAPSRFAPSFASRDRPPPARRRRGVSLTTGSPPTLTRSGSTTEPQTGISSRRSSRPPPVGDSTRADGRLPTLEIDADADPSPDHH
ncbi:hypothetical protein Dimus_035700, partial [Dionaea muscipula]